MYRVIAAALIAILAILPARAVEDGPLKAVVTVGMVADLVKAVGGEHVDVTTIVGSGVDPHAYRQTRRDVSRLASADIVFSVGLNLEAQLDDLLEKLSKKKPVVPVGELLSKDVLIEAEGFSGRYDPHVWMDPARWVKVVPVIVDALSNVDEANAPAYAANGKILADEMKDFNTKLIKVMATIPKEQRVLVTAHDAFSYFGDTFGIEVMGIQGLSTESEAGLNRIEAMVSILVDRGIKAIFVESSVSEKNIQALIEGARAKGHEVIVGGTLFSDAMGQEDTFEGTYIGMIDHNATTITRALGGSAPANGITAKLTPNS